MIYYELVTQVYENYARPDWDGTGICPEHWKPKGGSHFFIDAKTKQEALGKWHDWQKKENIYESEMYKEEIIVLQEREGDPYVYTEEELQFIEFAGNDMLKSLGVNREMLSARLIPLKFDRWWRGVDGRDLSMWYEGVCQGM